MSYHSMLLENGYSPSELHMGRQFRTTIPIIAEHLPPSVPPKFVIEEKEMMMRKQQQKAFNKHHCASLLKLLRLGDIVYILDNE